MQKNRDLMIGEIHCWLTDEDDTNYAQGSLSMILGLVSDYEQDFSELEIYRSIAKGETARVGNYRIVRLEPIEGEGEEPISL